MREVDAERVNRFIWEVRQRQKELEPLDVGYRGLGHSFELYETEASQIDELYEKRWAKMQSVVECIASQLGHGSIAGLDDGSLGEVVEDAVDAIDNWYYDAEMEMPAPEAKTPLQRLLADHHELGEQIQNIQDCAIERDEGRYPEGYPDIDRDDA